MNDDEWTKAIDQLASELIKKQYEFSSEQIHPCPVCGSQLKIQIGRYQRGNAKMIGITVECDKCENAIATDYREGEQ